MDTMAAGGSVSVLAFVACVALATYAQNLTGFAFGLILLGLTSVLHVASVTDAANSSMVLTLINAWAFFKGHREAPPWKLVRPTLAGSLCGVVVGVALLGWLSGSAVNYLRGLLGAAILGCAALLLVQGRPLTTISSPRSFTVVGILSGLLGGLFSSSGPPLVYQMYRQPMDRELVRRALLLVFAFNASVRLSLVLPTGQFSQHAVILTAFAVPMVYLVTRLHQRYPPRLSAVALRRLVAALLCASGGILLMTAFHQIAKAAATG